MKEENLILKVLAFATSRVEFSFEELCDAVKPSDVQRKQLILQIHYKELLNHKSDDFYNYGHKDTNVKLFASAEDHFRLLEYQELQEARASSISAIASARRALYVSIFTFIISVGFSIASIISDVNVPERMYMLLSEGISEHTDNQGRLLSTLELVVKDEKEIIQLMEVNKRLSKIEEALAKE